MYITSALQRTDMKAVGLQLALDLLHEKVMELSSASRVLQYHFHSSTAGQTGPDNGPQNPHQCWQTQLGQGLQAAAGAAEGQGHRLLLRSATAGQDAARQV